MVVLGSWLVALTTLTAQRRVLSHDPVTAIIQVCKGHDVVALGEDHGNEQNHAFRLRLVRHPGFSAVADDIVVEFGNSRYQDVIDRFMRGAAIPERVLRKVWQNTTMPHTIWDRPIYEKFLRAIRHVNASRPADQQLRVLLGDPPIDWDAVRTAADIAAVKARYGRSRHPAEVIHREVVARGRRALVMLGHSTEVHMLEGSTLVIESTRHAPIGVIETRTVLSAQP